MSPASKSKKEKKASKELQKHTSKVTGPVGGGSSTVTTSAYNPISGTFHALESTFSISSPRQSNSRFKNIDDADSQSGALLSSAAEYDCVSNTGSWSGESEDHKEKKSYPTVRQEPIPGADIDKREKNRQRNEKKHQRQKERRAQELHERCSGYLISRKLESLSQQLVAMGFLADRATVALMLNEGKIEESVAWLLEGGEEASNYAVTNQDLGGHSLKLDISEELARIAEMESLFKCRKQEVERVVIASEGDLEKAAESLRELKRDPPAPPPKPEETGDPPTALSSNFPGNTSQALRPQAKPNPPPIQLKKEEKDFNYTKVAITTGMSIESPDKSIPQPSRSPSSQPKMEWGNYEQTATAEKRWPTSGTAPISSLATSPTPSSPAPPIQNEPHYATAGGSESNLQSGPVREPSSTVQGRNQDGTSSSPPPSWYAVGIGSGTSPPSEFLQQIRSSLSLNRTSSDVALNDQMYPQDQYQQQQPQREQQPQQFVAGSSPADFLELSPVNTPRSRTSGTTSIAPASSLGLFSGSSQLGPTHPVDWSSGSSIPHYSTIDWSVNRSTPPTSPRPSGGGGLQQQQQQQGLNHQPSPYMQQMNPRAYESSGPRSMDHRDHRFVEPRDHRFIEPRDPRFIEPRDPRFIEPRDPRFMDPWDPRFVDPRFVDARDPRFVDPRDPRFVDARDPRFMDAQPFVPPGPPNMSGRVPMVGFQNRRGFNSERPANNSSYREWSSPFQGNDIFNFPRQFGPSPPRRKFYDNK